MKPFITFLFFVISFFTIAQTPEINFQKSYGGSSDDGSGAMVSLSDGGFVFVAGSKSDLSGDKSTNCYGDSDYWVVKTGAQGDVVWDMTIGGNKFDVPNDICKTPDGGFLVIGTSSSGVSGTKTAINYGQEDVWLVKLDANGYVEWDKSFGGTGSDRGIKIVPLPNGNFLLGSTLFSSNNGNVSVNKKGSADYWGIEIDSIGTILKQFAIGGVLDEVLRDVLVMDDNKYLFTGSSESFISGDKTEPVFGSDDYWIAIIDSNGIVLKERTYGGTSGDNACSSILGMNGSIFILGHSDSEPSGSKTAMRFGNSDIWVLNLDSNLNLVNDFSYGGSYNEFVRRPLGLYREFANDIIIAGYSNSEPSGNKGTTLFQSTTGWGYDIWMFGIDELGNMKFELALGGDGDDFPGEIIRSESDLVVLVGQSSSSISGVKTDETNGGADVWFLELDLMVSIEKVQIKNELKTYPNPAQTVLNFSIPLEVQKSIITLTDLSGKVVHKEKIGMIKDHRIDVSNLPSGMYVLTVKSDAFYYNRKVVIE